MQTTTGAALAQALPGIDSAQAGWGLIVCVSSVLSITEDAAPESNAPEPKRRRWFLERKPQKGGDLLGTALVDSLAVIAGDAWIGS